MSHTYTNTASNDTTAVVAARIEEISSVTVRRIQQVGPDKFAVIYEECLYAGPNAGRKAGQPMLTVVTVNGELDGKWHLRCKAIDSANVEFDKVIEEHSWIPWAGGECPLPEGTPVDVRYRDGREAHNVRCLMFEDQLSDASCAFWLNEDMQNDIVAYRKAVAKGAA